MIVDNGKYYVYRYIRHDKNEPFYIGIGSKNKSDSVYGYYGRAHVKKKRNIIWTSIINKTSYEVGILLESDDYDFIQQKEKEFIKLYGRIDKGTGTLANMTDGGEGSWGIVITEEGREKRRKINKGRKATPESLLKRKATIERLGGIKVSESHKDTISITEGKPIVQFTLKGTLITVHPSLRIASKNTGCSVPQISGSLHSKSILAGLTEIGSGDAFIGFVEVNQPVDEIANIEAVLENIVASDNNEVRKELIDEVQEKEQFDS